MDDWKPPGKDCGACGATSCAEFLLLLKQTSKSREDCPFSETSDEKTTVNEGNFTGIDICGR
jgi:CO dehydrogenase/acetyl-CoA synthase gamma subunit (corrinoid Fe-S protein)